MFLQCSQSFSVVMFGSSAHVIKRTTAFFIFLLNRLDFDKLMVHKKVSVTDKRERRERAKER